MMADIALDTVHIIVLMTIKPMASPSPGWLTDPCDPALKANIPRKKIKDPNVICYFENIIKYY